MKLFKRRLRKDILADHECSNILTEITDGLVELNELIKLIKRKEALQYLNSSHFRN